MEFKLRPEPARRSERITVALPLELHEQLEFYRQRLGHTTMNYICVEGLRAFLETDRQFQKAWADRSAGGSGASAPPPPPPPLRSAGHSPSVSAPAAAAVSTNQTSVAPAASAARR